MPIKIQNGLPAKEILENENIFVIDEKRAKMQDIRPLKICILNLMPVKQETELHLLRALSNTPLQVDITLMKLKSHTSLNTSTSHLNEFYQSFDELSNNKYDGFIITGAPVEQIPFEEVDYWEELITIMEWSKQNITSTLHICWGAQAALYYHFGIQKTPLNEKLFGLFWHKVANRKEPLVRGFDDCFLAPHSRYTQVDTEEIRQCDQLMILAESKEAGVFLAAANEGKQIFVMGHPEYDKETLHNEYRRDKDKGLDIKLPENYYINDDENGEIKLQWRANSNNLYTNWLNYYVYQMTPYEL